MTSVGRFSLKSETEDNRSIPTFFLALSGEKITKSTDDNDSTTKTLQDYNNTNRKLFTVTDFEEQWLKQDMPLRHPRFHSTVCDEQKYFNEIHHHVVDEDSDESTASTKIKAELDQHASETLHYSVYREDLRNRIEHMLTSPLEVSNKLWEVKMSNGKLGSSGAICKAKVDAITKSQSSGLKRKMTRGGLWKDATHEVENIPMESLLLFRSHHALADGASIMAALSDMCDEAEEIRADIETKLKKWKRKGGGRKKSSFLRRIWGRFMRLVKLCLWLSFGTLGALMYQGYLQLTTRSNPFDAVRKDADKKGLVQSGRSVSWCDGTPLDEVKKIADTIGRAKGITITVNDLFVSCVTAAVTRQLIEHEEFMAPMDAHKRKYVSPNINVVVPVHLRGGVIMPGESVGNKIGAFVTRVPGEMKHDAVGGATCPSERLEKVHNSLLYSKKSPAPIVSYYIAKFCSNCLPENWTKVMFQRANANAVVAISNNRGYEHKLHINGMTVESAAGFLPLPSGIPIGVVVQSYAGTMSLSVVAEKWAVPDGDKFLRWTLDEYRRLRDVAIELEKK